jgi:hypothetical protein
MIVGSCEARNCLWRTLASGQQSVQVALTPSRVLPGWRYEGLVVPHFDKAEVHQSLQMRPVDGSYHPALGDNVFERPSEIDGFKSKFRQRIFVVFHSYYFQSRRAFGKMQHCLQLARDIPAKAAQRAKVSERASA